MEVVDLGAAEEEGEVEVPEGLDALVIISFWLLRVVNLGWVGLLRRSRLWCVLIRGL